MTADDPQAILDRAGRAFSEGRYADAAADFQTLTTAYPDIGELYINLGAALRAAGDKSGAEQALQKAVRLLPESAAAWFNLANLLSADKRGKEAIGAYEKADKLQPGTPEILNNLGVQLYETGRIEDALKKYDAALDADPGFADALTNRGNALQRMCRMADAEASIDAALSINPGHAVYRLNKSSYFAANGRHAEALTWADKSIDADPTYTEARLKKASLLVQTGDLEAGFREYEARWNMPNWHSLLKKLTVPPWRGEDIAGQTLLIWNEQGFGDALIYARYLPVLAAQGVKVRLMVEAPLMRLFEGSFEDIPVSPLDGPPPEADQHCSIMSLPFLTGTTMTTIPAEVPYLKPDQADVERWQAEINGERPSVGLIWAGNPGQAHDYSRSLAAETIMPLIDRDDVRFFNLLVGPRGDELSDPRVLDVRACLNDFAQTAALMQNLDLVISVDSAPAHLAGALGRPLWVLLAFDPDSRYFLERTDSPWYPTARLFRQPSPGEWASVIERTVNALDTFVGTIAKR